MSEPVTAMDIDRIIELVRSEPDEERECRLCHVTMAAPDVGLDVTPLCTDCSLDALHRLADEVERLRAPGPSGATHCPTCKRVP